MIIKNTLMPSSASSSLSLETNSLPSSNNLNSNNDLNQPHGDEIYGFTTAVEGNRNNLRRQSKRDSKVNLLKNKSSSNGFEASSQATSGSKSANQLNEGRRSFHFAQGLSRETKWTQRDGKLAWPPEKVTNCRLGHRYSHSDNLKDVNSFYNQSSVESNIDKLNSDTDDIDCIYENMRDIVSISSRISSSSSSAAQSHQYSRKLTKDSGYESAASNWSSLGNINSNCPPTHSRSDSTESSVSTGDGLNSYKLTTTTSSKNLRPRYFEKWSTKSVSNLPIQIEKAQNGEDGFKKSSTECTKSNRLSLPSKAYLNSIDQEKLSSSDDQLDSQVISKKQSHLLPHKIEPKSASNSNKFSFTENVLVRFANERNHRSQNLSDQLKLFSPAQINSSLSKDYLESKDDSPPPTPPVRDSSLRASLMSTSRTISQTVHSAMARTSSIFKSSNGNSSRGSWSAASFHRKQSKPTTTQSASALLIKQPFLALSEKKAKSFSKINNYRKCEQVIEKIGPNCEQTIIDEVNREHNNLESRSLTQSAGSKIDTSKLSSSSLSSLTNLDYNQPSLINNGNITNSNISNSSSNGNSSAVPSLPARNVKKSDRSFNLKNHSPNSGIARSAKVKQPKRQDSASVLYYDSSKSSSSSLSASSLNPLSSKISSTHLSSSSSSSSSPPPPPLPPKNRPLSYQDNLTTNNHVNQSSKELEPFNIEKLNRSPKSGLASNREVSTKMSGPDLKAIQKQAVLEFVLKCKREEKAKLSDANSLKNETFSKTFDLQVSNNKWQEEEKVSSIKSSSSMSKERVKDAPDIQQPLLNFKSPTVLNCLLSSPPSPPLPPSPPPLPPPLPPPPPLDSNETEVTTDLPFPPPPSPHTAISSNLFVSNSSLANDCLFQIKSDTYITSQLVSHQNEDKHQNKLDLMTKSVTSSKLTQHERPVRLEIATQTGTLVSSNQVSANQKSMTLISFNSNFDKMEPDLNLAQNRTHCMQPLDGLILENNNNNFKPLNSWNGQNIHSPHKLSPKPVQANDQSKTSISLTTSPSLLFSSLESLHNGQLSDNQEEFTGTSETDESLKRKDVKLKEELESLTKDQNQNDAQGDLLLKKLSNHGMSNEESEKILAHLDEIERVTRLLLSLNGRSKCIEKEIKEKVSKNITSSTFDIQPELSTEMQVLLSKRCKLNGQVKEAVRLRESIEKRSRIITETILSKYFEEAQDLIEFEEFIKAKSDLIVKRRAIIDKIEKCQKRMELLNKF